MGVTGGSGVIGCGTGGGGGSDTRRFFASLLDLQTQYPTGTPIKYAFVGDPPILHVWSGEQNAWITSGESNLNGSVVNDVIPALETKTIVLRPISSVIAMYQIRIDATDGIYNNRANALIRHLHTENFGELDYPYVEVDTELQQLFNIADISSVVSGSLAIQVQNLSTNPLTLTIYLF